MLYLGDVVRLPKPRALHRIEEEPSVPPSTPAEPPPRRRVAARQLDGADADRKYRGRSDPDYTQSQPIPAPSSLAAQREEGFKRFYKAVVSPTHIRVTAGGRIVPNTRGSSSPTRKAVKSQASAEEDLIEHGRSYDGRPSQGYPYPFGAQVPFPTIMPGIGQGLPATGGSMPFPMMPWQMGMNVGNPFGMFAPPMGNYFQPSAAMPISYNPLKQEDGRNTHVAEIPYVMRPPHMVPFDPTRQFLCNGQWFSPVPGATFTPGMPPYQVMPNHASNLNNNSHPEVANVIQKHVLPGGQQASLSCHDAMGMGPPGGRGFSTAPLSPISSIRPSDITKKQIDVLRGSLNYLEDQLQYNRHQINEKSVEVQAQSVSQQIQQFKKTYAAQLSFEESFYPRLDSKDEASSSASVHSGPISKSSAASEQRGDQSLETAASQDARYGRTGAQSFNVDQVKAQSAIPSQLQYDPGNKVCSLGKAPSFDLNAATAPVFQPRMGTRQQERQGLHLEDNPVNRKRGSILQDCVNASPVQPFSASMVMSSKSRSKSGSDKPYLIGQPSRDFGTHHMQGFDYQYARDLTEDEVKARHMYWGTMPRLHQGGLPKFDGKDFYPPSPSKITPSEDSAHQSIPTWCVPTAGAGKGYSESYSREKSNQSNDFTSSGRRESYGLRASTQSESLPTSGTVVASSEHSSHQYTRPLPVPVGQAYNDFSRSTEATLAASVEGLKVKTPSSDEDEDRNLLFKGRKTGQRTG